MFSDPETALDTMVREELGLDPDQVGAAGAWVAASSSFVAFASGALLPLVPFLLMAGGLATIVVSALVSAAALATVGGALGILTKRPVPWSAARMVLIGGAAATATYGIGSLFGVVVG